MSRTGEATALRVSRSRTRRLSSPPTASPLIRCHPHPGGNRSRGASGSGADHLGAGTNRQVAGIETVFVVTGENFAYTSSSLIKQIAAFGGTLEKLEPLVPRRVIDALAAKKRDPRNPLGMLAAEHHGGSEG